MVEATIDLEAVERHEFMIKSDFDDSLNTLRAKLTDITNAIPDEYSRVGQELGLELEKKLKLEKNAQNGYFFRVTRNVSRFSFLRWAFPLRLTFPKRMPVC